MDKYAVIGNPIEHSKSPQIHTAFAQQTGQMIEYGKILVPLDQFDQYCADFFRDGKGCNVTVPFKEKAYSFAGRLTRRAEDAGAVNTLSKQADGTIEGDNTDGVGIVRDIVHNHKGIITNKNILILGAGGAVRGVLGPILDENPKSVTVANRTATKAIELASRFADRGTVYGCGFDGIEPRPYDLIINGTAASLSGELPPIPKTVISPQTWTYDMMYGAEKTVFSCWAESLGAVCSIDGLGMLIEQAAESFYIWRGVRPDTAPVIQHFS